MGKGRGERRGETAGMEGVPTAPVIPGRMIGSAVNGGAGQDPGETPCPSLFCVQGQDIGQVLLEELRRLLGQAVVPAAGALGAGIGLIALYVAAP